MSHDWTNSWSMRVGRTSATSIRGRLRSYFEAAIRPLIEAGDKSVVISNEQLTQTERMNRTMVARRVRTLFGDCRIVVVIRHQLTWLESMYFWDFGKGHVRGSFETYLFLNWRGPRSGLGNARFIDYASLTKSYADVFGHKNVGVFLFEELGKDPRDFARRLCRFIGIDEEEGAKTVDETSEMARMSRIQYLRVKHGIVPHARLSRLLPPALDTLIQKVGGQPKRAKASPEWVGRVEDSYRESNRRVAQEYGLPLEEFGYPV